MTSSQRSRRHQSHSSYNASAASNSHGQTQESSLYHGGMITEISDYFDKAQIHNALSNAANTDEKIKLVDFIIRNREVKHRLRKKKSSKASELNNAAQRINTVYPYLSNKTNKFKKSLQDLVEQEPSLKETNPTISSLIDIGHESELIKKYKPFVADSKDDGESDDSGRSEVEGTRLVFPVEESAPILQRMPSHGKLISLSSFSSSNGLKFGYSDSLFRKKPGHVSGHPSPRVKPLGKVEESPSTWRNISRGSSNASYSLLNQKRAKESLPLSRVQSSNTQDNSIFSLGAKRLEKDIYRYLVKNEKKKLENKVVLDMNHSKEKIRDIEAKAIMQYKQAKRADEKFSDYKDNFTMAIKTERARTRSVNLMNTMNNSSGKSDTSQLSLSRSGSKGMIKFDQAKRCSRFIRKVDMDKISLPKPVSVQVPALKKKVSIEDLDDSFNSYTEARLDCLYTETERLSRGVEDIEHKMALAHDEGELKSLLKARDMKKSHLRRQTGKIEVLVKKKMMTAFA